MPRLLSRVWATESNVALSQVARGNSRSVDTSRSSASTVPSVCRASVSSMGASFTARTAPAIVWPPSKSRW